MWESCFFCVRDGVSVADLFIFFGKWNGAHTRSSGAEISPGPHGMPLTIEECVTVKYINAKEVLPENLLLQLQEYVQGKMIYIPGRDAERAAWGESNGTRAQYLERNREIVTLYRNGLRVDDLAERYHLSPCSSRTIVHGKAGHVLLTR